MPNELEPKKTATAIDGFEGFEDATEGEQERGGQVIQGQRIKFTNEATWVTEDGEKIAKDREFVPIDVARVVQCWQDHKPIKTIVLEPGQKFPNVKELNAAVPQSEWEEGPDGKPRGPWQAQHIIYMLDPKTMDRFSFPTGTIGGAVATRDLTDKVKMMRKFRGENLFPVVCLRDVFWPTRYGGRQRPHFDVRRWIRFGDGEAVTGPSPVALNPPSAKEVTDDTVPF
jgi:hypothetical protein